MAERLAHIDFEHLLDFFPLIELPATIGEDTHEAFSQNNEPLPVRVIAQFIQPTEPDEIDESVTEYVACFALPPADHYAGIVYWRAGLLDYQYVLLTLDPRTEEMIDRRVIAGTTVVDGELVQSSCAISEDLLIYIVSGQGSLEGYDYSAARSTANRFQVTERGKIVEL